MCQHKYKEGEILGYLRHDISATTINNSSTPRVQSLGIAGVR
jgi:hypothetical protein